MDERFKMKRKWLLAVGLVLLSVIIVLSGCSGGEVPSQPVVNVEIPAPAPAPVVNVPAPTPQPVVEVTEITPAAVRVSLGSQQEGILVSGEGKVTAIPDLATLSLGIVAQSTSVAVAQSQAAEAMGEVMVALTDNGVAREDIQTQYFNVQQVTRWDSMEQEEVVIGYRVTNMVTAKISEIDKVGFTIDAVTEAGGDLARINSIGFSVDDPSSYHVEARKEAMADAKAKAQQMARLAGVNLGKPTYISESLAIPYPIYPRAAFEAGASMAVPPAPISPGEMDITITVQVTYAIQ